MSKLEKRIKALQQENVGGATLCLQAAMEIVKECKMSDLERVCDQLVAAKPEMVSIRVATERCRKAGAEAPAEAEAILGQMARANAEIATKAVSLCNAGDRILTHSASGTVREALLAAHEAHNIEVYVTESRPMNEGVGLARALAAAGVEVTLLVDAAAATVLPRMDALWVGADAIAPDFFVNKVGTLGLALAAHRLEVPLHLLADQLKRLPAGMAWQTSGDHPPEEVISKPPKGVRILNPYFEKVPGFLVSKWLSDELT